MYEAVRFVELSETLRVNQSKHVLYHCGHFRMQTFIFYINLSPIWNSISNLWLVESWTQARVWETFYNLRATCWRLGHVYGTEAFLITVVHIYMSERSDSNVKAAKQCLSNQALTTYFSLHRQNTNRYPVWKYDVINDVKTLSNTKLRRTNAYSCTAHDKAPLKANKIYIR